MKFNFLFFKNKLWFLEKIPLRFISFLWGKIVSIHLPRFLRAPVYKAYSGFFQCNFDEMSLPLEEYSSLSAFFDRRLKPGSRQIADIDGLVSPVDGRVLCFGEIQGEFIEQVKGIKYSRDNFLGQNLIPSQPNSSKKLYHCVIYLAPGDYHGIHSPVDWSVEIRRHFPGYLFPVAPRVVNFIQGLFALNERVVLAGKWKYGFFSLTAVGATNVGTISVAFDPVKFFFPLKQTYLIFFSFF